MVRGNNDVGLEKVLPRCFWLGSFVHVEVAVDDGRCWGQRTLLGMTDAKVDLISAGMSPST